LFGKHRIFLAIAIWQKNFLFAIFILIAEILILIWSNEKPKILKFKLNDEGLYIGENKFHNIKEMDAFSSTKSVFPDFWDFKIHFKKYFSLELKLLIPEEFYEEIKSFLLQKNIKEKEYEESFFDIIQRLVKF
jgi:hypothetical protein